MWRGERMGQLSLLFVAVIVVTACGSASTSTSTDSTVITHDGEATADATSTPAGVKCVAPGQAFEDGGSVELVRLGVIDGVNVSAAFYPRPEYDAKLWSQWGQGIVVEDGRFFSAIGDHNGPDGNSYVYEYDPDSNRLTLIGDILSQIDHVPGTWGYGKIHSQMVPGPCGKVYFSTYWGSSRDLVYEGNYTGDIIFRLDPGERTMAPLSVPVEFHGQASLASDPAKGLIYGEAVDPIIKQESDSQGPFFVYDLSTEETVFTGPDQPHVGYRSILTDAQGIAYWSIGGGELQTYDPATGETDTHNATLPGDWLRAVTKPDQDGSVYGVTREPDTFFAMDQSGDITSLGDALGYTASMALSPDGDSFFYMPGAHGKSSDWDSPLISVDTTTGEQTVVVELNDLVVDQTGYKVGGTYNIAVDPDSSRVFIGANVSLPDGDGFDEVMLLVLDLP